MANYDTKGAASELVRPKAGEEVLKAPPIAKSTGSENIAKVLGSIAERSFTQATNFANEASKANLLQTHGMLQDVDAQSKIEMLRSPEHAEAIAKNAEQSIAKIKSMASLNRADKLNLESYANTAVRGLNLSAAEKSISLSRAAAKDNYLTTFGDTLQSITKTAYSNPEQAESLIQAQYESLHGAVRSGIITAVEAANMHKQVASQLEFAHEIGEGLRSGLLTASDVNAMHDANTGQVPLSNAGLPINNDTAMRADHFFGTMTLTDLKSQYDNGSQPSRKDIVGIKKTSDLDHLFNYGIGAHQANGDLRSLAMWPELEHKLKTLKATPNKTARQEGDYNRLKNFFNNVDQPGAYLNFIAHSPEGARNNDAYTLKQSAINQEVIYGDDDQVAKIKGMKTVDNLNEWISKNAILGQSMHYPDHLVNPIPLEMMRPISNGFNKDGDVTSAINNLSQLNAKNRVYAMNAFGDNPRKQLTVYAIGNLVGKADSGFLVDLMKSQQVDSLGEKPGRKDSQQKFMQLETDKHGYSDKKLAARIAPQLSSFTGWLRLQPNGANVVSAQVDQAVRYLKYTAANHNDFTFTNIDDYINTYKKNMDAAFQVSTGYNWSMDDKSVPLEDNQKQVLASHYINEVREKLLEYNTPNEVENIFSSRPPLLRSSPGGRLKVVFPDGQVVPDKNGHAAFDEVYTESVWQKAEHDLETKSNIPKRSLVFGSGFELLHEGEKDKYLRASPEIIRPVVEGNIDLENRPKVWDKEGHYSTVKTITIEMDGKTILIPTIINGETYSNKEAIEHYKKTHEHLGVFKNKEDADKYDEQLHKRMGWIGEANKWGKK